ncbi:Multidrug resistance-associated protein 4 [Nymphon striatum]|nr:Multidrug resistance-associated protein 4 [Nymphon striatum]
MQSPDSDHHVKLAKDDMPKVLKIRDTVMECMGNPFASTVAAEKLVNIAKGEIFTSSDVVDSKQLGLDVIAHARSTDNAEKIISLKILTCAGQQKQRKKRQDSVKQIVSEEGTVTRALCFTRELKPLAKNGVNIPMTSVERVLEYGQLSPEAPKETVKNNKPPVNWPYSGRIEMKDLSVKYNPEGPSVLKNVSCEIHAHEKIGIVGRTGAGKSTLISALFRLTEPEGYIKIDNVITKDLGLHDLRNSISIIPQDPLLFTNTIRYNLDPFEKHCDEELWEVLSQVCLKDVVSSFTCGLSTDLIEGGNNFSVGQRQLVCLARCLLKKNRILILDEATSNVDIRTDYLIQQVIQKKFKDCTVLTIAHRLNTVINSDRIMVLHEGKIAEFDSPQTLGHAESYSFSLELETALGVALEEASSLFTPQIVRNPTVPAVFHSDFDNLDQLINDLSGSGSIHASHGIMLQNIPQGQDTTNDAEGLVLSIPKTRERSMKSDLDSDSLPPCYITQRDSPKMNIVRLSIPDEGASLKSDKMMKAWCTVRLVSSVNEQCLRQSKQASAEVGQKYAITTFDEGVCMKAYPLLWKMSDYYKDHIVMIGSFHLVCAYLKMVGKKMSGSGFSEIMLESGLMSSGSLKGVTTGKNYSRAIHCHKTMVEALEQLLLKTYHISIGHDEPLENMPHVNALVATLVQDISKENLESLMNKPSVLSYLDGYAGWICPRGWGRQTKKDRPVLDVIHGPHLLGTVSPSCCQDK